MKLVVFGATGNVGQRVAAEALRRGHEVTGVVRDPTAVQSPDPRVRLVKGDATSADSVTEIAPGQRTGKYHTADDKLLVDDKGKSFITFEDYAVAVLDELERPQHVAKRFGVAY